MKVICISCGHSLPLDAAYRRLRRLDQVLRLRRPVGDQDIRRETASFEFAGLDDGATVRKRAREQSPRVKEPSVLLVMKQISRDLW